MTSVEMRRSSVLTRWPLKPLGWLLSVLGFLLRFVVLAWASLAIYYSNLPWAWA
jgi:hypothetical protein